MRNGQNKRMRGRNRGGGGGNFDPQQMMQRSIDNMKDELGTTDEELQAIVSTAHSLNRRVVADGAGKRDSAAGVNAAIKAGVDWVDTVIYPDRNTWPMLVKAGVMVPADWLLTWLVGALMVARWSASSAVMVRLLTPAGTTTCS